MISTRFAVVVACVAAVTAVLTACGDADETAGVGTHSSAAITPSPPATPSPRDTTAPSQPADPFDSPPPPRTFIDEQGLRCVEYETSTANRAASGVCFDDSHDDLGIRTVEAGDHYPKATIIGGTDNADAVRVVIASGDSEQAVSLTVVDGWPERIFAADLPAGAVEVRLEADDGHVLSSTST